MPAVSPRHGDPHDLRGLYCLGGPNDARDDVRHDPNVINWNEISLPMTIGQLSGHESKSASLELLSRLTECEPTLRGVRIRSPGT